MKHKIISTGSKGNAVIIEEKIMIDCGVPFKWLLNDYKDINLVLLTHIHSDHLNKTTIKRLMYERPSIRFGSPAWLLNSLLEIEIPITSIDLLEMDNTYFYNTLDLYVMPFKVKHNVENCGYKIMINGKRLFYATDLNNLKNIKAEKFDLYMLEANYKQEELINRIKDKTSEGVYSYEHDVINNHLSVEKANNWLYENMGSNSRYVYLHGHT